MLNHYWRNRNTLLAIQCYHWSPPTSSSWHGQYSIVYSSRLIILYINTTSTCRAVSEEIETNSYWSNKTTIKCTVWEDVELFGRRSGLRDANLFYAASCSYQTEIRTQKIFKAIRSKDRWVRSSSKQVQHLLSRSSLNRILDISNLCANISIKLV